MAQMKRVTMQDVADACGLSRNTVSKIFNNRGGVPGATRDFVLTKAQEMGYIQSSDADFLVQPSGYIALLTHNRPMHYNFGSLSVTAFSDQISRAGYNLRVYEISAEDYAQCRLPSHFVPGEVSGIIAVELFDREYTQMICALGVPTLLIDSYACAPSDLMQCDLVYMENYASAIALTAKMIACGAESVGFVGDMNHCSSFRERWNGFRAAMNEADLPVDKSLCILSDDADPYGQVDWVLEQINALPYIPDGFVCANDFIAIRVMHALRRKGLSVPEDVMVTGFDGSPEAEIVYPPLTTAQIPSAEMGRVAADILLDRITSPDRPFRSVFIKTTPIWRDSLRLPEED